MPPFVLKSFCKHYLDKKHQILQRNVRGHYVSFKYKTQRIVNSDRSENLTNIQTARGVKNLIGINQGNGLQIENGVKFMTLKT